MSTIGASRKRKERDGSGPAAKAEPEVKPADNRLLAGYLAYEFLTRGTILGRRPGPDRAEPAPAQSPSECAYADVAVILKAGGVHVPGVVNPTELGRWLQL